MTDWNVPGPDLDTLGERARRREEILATAQAAHPEYAQLVREWTADQRQAVEKTLVGLASMMLVVASDPSPELGGNAIVRATLLGVNDTLELMRVVARG